MIVIHPRESYKVWLLGEYRFALRVWRSTWSWLTLQEWWSDRPWKGALHDKIVTWRRRFK